MPVNGKWMTPPDGGPNKWVINEQVPDAAASGFAPQPGDDQIGIVDQHGNLSKIGLADYPSMARVAGERLATQQELDAFKARADAEAEHSGVLNAVRAAGTSALNAAAFHIPQIVGHHLAPGIASDIEATEAAHPIASGVGTIAGLAAPLLLSGGAAAPAEVAGEAATEGIAGKVLGSTAGGVAHSLGRATGEAIGGGLGRIAGGVVEGGALTAPDAAEHLIDSNDPLTVEHLTDAIKDVGTGALLGGGLSAAGEVIGAGSRSAKRIFASGIKNAGADVEQVARAAAAAPDEALAGKSVEQIKNLEDAHKAEVHTQWQEGQKQVIRDVDTDIKQHVKDVQTSGALMFDEAGLEKTGKSLQGMMDLRRAADEQVSASVSPGRFKRSLGLENTALAELKDAITPAKLDELAAKDAIAANRLEASMAKNLSPGEKSAFIDDRSKAFDKFKQWNEASGDATHYKAVTNGDTKGFSVPREVAEQFIDDLKNGGLDRVRRQFMTDGIDKLLGDTDALRARIDVAAAKAPPPEAFQTPRAAQLALARAAAAAPMGTGARILHKIADVAIMKHALGGVTGGLMGGPLGMVAGIIGTEVAGPVMRRLGNAVFRRGAGVAADGALRTASVIKSLAGAVPRAAIPTAVDALNGHSGAGHKALAAAYHASAAQAMQGIQMGPTGQLEASPAQRQRIADQLRPISAAHPMLADKLEAGLATKQAFVASKVPKPPDHAVVHLGPQKPWQPSDQAMAKYARYVRAASDGGGIEERAAQGATTPEDAETYAALFPARKEHLAQQLVANASKMGRLTLNQRISLQRLTGAQLVGAMSPAIAAVIQGAHQQEPGTAGGFQAPQGNAKPPAYKSTVSLQKQLQSQYTPAQQRTA